MISLLVVQGQKMLSMGNSPQARQWVFVMTAMVATIFVTTDVHAILLDPARAGLTGDLTDAGFDNAKVVGLFCGLLVFVLIAIPIGTGSMALANMNRGTEVWKF